MSDQNEAHTTFQTNSGVGAAIPVGITEITTDEILFSVVNLGIAGTISSGVQNVTR